YTLALRKAWAEVPGGADLVTYWFAKAWEMMHGGAVERAGLVATNSIRGGASREVLKPIVIGGRIFDAWSDEGWTVEGAAVRVSLICFDLARVGDVRLNGVSVEKISADLTSRGATADLTNALTLTQNSGASFIGVFL